MSICFRRYAGSSTVIPGLGQSSFLALYLRMDFNNTPTSLALFPERPFFCNRRRNSEIWFAVSWAEKNGPKNGQNIVFQYIGVPGKGGPFQVILLVRKKPLRSLIQCERGSCYRRFSTGVQTFLPFRTALPIASGINIAVLGPAGGRPSPDIPPLPPAIFSLVNVLSTLRHIGSSLTMYLTAYFTCISRFDRYSWHKCAETEYNYHAYL